MEQIYTLFCTFALLILDSSMFNAINSSKMNSLKAIEEFSTTLEDIQGQQDVFQELSTKQVLTFLALEDVWQLLSSRCILSMKRLLTRTNNPFKISSKFRKQSGSLSIISLNSKDKEEALEHQKSHHRMN